MAPALAATALAEAVMAAAFSVLINDSSFRS
jgi:hypothetical protein